jgi:hypothetical protein
MVSFPPIMPSWTNRKCTLVSCVEVSILNTIKLITSGFVAPFKDRKAQGNQAQYLPNCLVSSLSYSTVWVVLILKAMKGTHYRRNLEDVGSNPISASTCYCANH